jgi:NADH:ubiquinone oxidoreductase subunit F (NADH-binding)
MRRRTEVKMLGVPRLLSGPPVAEGPERHAAHEARLGRLRPEQAAREIVPALEASGLLGRGGAAFPVGRKWRALAERSSGPAVVVANGAEGEPASHKDRTLMAARPHLVIDGAALAAAAVGAEEIVFYVGREHAAAVGSMRAALAERRAGLSPAVRLVLAPISYVAGEATAAVHYINSGDARPTTTPPRMSERGVGGRPTLVQNVESLAHAALIGRYGADSYRSAGRNGAAGTALVTLSGAVARPGVREIELGTTLGDVVTGAGGPTRPLAGVILGGYFGAWARSADIWDVPMEAHALKGRGHSLGCGMIGLLPDDACGVEATAGIMGFMARESAGQCGPCVHGLRAIGETTARVAADEAGRGDLDDLRRWTSLVAGRGACRHPDGAAQLMASALDVFAADFASHAATGRCLRTGLREAVA